MTHKLSMITHLIALLLPLLAVFSSCKGEEPIEPQEPEEPIHVAVESVELNERYLTLRAGEEAPLIASIYPSDATDQSLDWESDDQDVAAFFFNGRDGFFYVHANGAGVNGNQKCSDFGNIECSIFGIKTTVLLASAVQ